MKQLVILTRGLPASGKTTWAKAMVANDPNYVNVCKDDIRPLLISVNGRVDEKAVITIRDNMIREALSQGKDVIVSDTNLNPHHLKSIRANFESDTVSVVLNDDFLGVSVEECIARDAKREKSVGRKVIEEMHNQYRYIFENYMTKNRPKMINKDGTPALICDLDGTLAHMNDRSPYDYSRVYEDHVNEHVRFVVKMLQDAGNHVVFCSGRDDKCMDLTTKWLNEKAGFDNFTLLMRKTGDQRKDSIIKKEIYLDSIYPHYRVDFVFDDRLQVCQMWHHDLGLNLFRVGDPNANF